MDILLTGATGGIGEQIVRHLSEHHNVIAVGRDKKKRDALGVVKNVRAVKLDICSPKDVAAFISTQKKLDAVINCAAILGPVGKLGDNDPKLWQKTIQTNLLGTVFVCQFALPQLLKSRHGEIINFSGGGAAQGRPNHTAYAASKAAVVRFTETLALEYPSLDINVIAPGPHKTGIWKNETDDEPKELGDKDRLLEFIDFLLSEKSNGITGKFLHYKDDWEHMKPSISKSDRFTLRRKEK